MLAVTRSGILILLLGGLTVAVVAPTRAAETADRPPAAVTPVSPAELDRAIDETIQQKKYLWRIPRERAAPTEAAEPGILAKFFESVGRMIRDALKATLEWVGRVLRKIFGGINWNFTPGGGSGSGWTALLQVLLYVLVAAVLLVIGFMLIRLWRNRQPKPELVQTEALQPVPDLLD
jgi:hypothetical protein